MHNSFISQLTTGFDLAFTLKELSTFTNREGLILAYHSRDERNIDMVKFGATRPSQI